MNAKTGSFVYVPSNRFTMKKGRTYRLNYFIKRGSGVSGAEISNEFITSDGTVIVFEESMTVSLSSTGTPNSVRDNGNKSLDSASVDYIRFKFESVTGGTEFYFSDVTVSEFSNFVTVTKNTAEGGNVEINGSTDESVEIGQYRDIEVKIIPAYGKRIKSAYMGDTDIKALVADSVKGGTVNLVGIGKDSRLNVEFENAAADAPGFSGNVSVIKTDDYEYAENCEYGFEITDPISGNALILKSAENAVSEQSFGIRIIGAVLAGDSNYKFRPYVIVENKAYYGNAAYVIGEE